MRKITIVTGYVKIPDHPRGEDEYRRLGEKLLQIQGTPVRVFRGDLRECWLAECVRAPTVVTHSTSDNPRKNTLDYHVVQHQKTAWLATAAAEDPTISVLIWIDYGIFSQPGVTAAVIEEYLHRIAEPDGELDEIYIPGAWDSSDTSPNHPDWRFCGSSLIMPRQHALPFHEAVKKVTLERIAAHQHVTWEINDWAVVEKQRALPIRWYKADHNQTQFTNVPIARPIVALGAQLDELATKYGTDKGIWGYLPHYARELEHRRSKVTQVLEIGICGQRDIPNNVTGASLWMWHDYFPNAHVHGIDIDPKWMIQHDRISSYVGDQGNPASLAAIAAHGGSFDLIVDDAVHDPDIQLVAMRALLPFLKPDGLYAIEDVCPYKLPGNDIALMTSQVPSGYSCEVIRTHKPEVLLFIKKSAASLDRPLLGIVMIVKNEAARISAVLQTFRPVIDHWTILDTGSTDGTQDIVKRDLAGIPGELHEEPFVDFATSRNRAIELHGTKTTFMIMPNGDSLIGAEELRTFLEVRKNDHATAYKIRIAPGHYYHPLVMRTGRGWHYEGRTHECLMGAGDGGQIPDVMLVRDRSQRTDDQWKERWIRDVQLLQLDIADKPHDPRGYFYLGQTYDCLGKYEDALTYYQKRAAMHGYFDETFEAKLRIGKMHEKLRRPWSQALAAYLDAYAFDPRRAEPLACIAEHYHAEDNHTLTYLFAALAATIPKPQTDLFLDEGIYEVRAADLAAISAYYAPGVSHDDGRRHAIAALRARPDDERIRANHAFYTKSAAGMFGATLQGIDVAPESPYSASTPSILFTDGRWRCIVRAVNYRIDDGRYLMPPGDVKIRTRNYMLELVRDKDGRFSTQRSIEIVDRAERPRTDYVISGYEDCRLFDHAGRLFFTATVCDLTNDGQREIVLAHLGDDYAVEKIVPLRGPWSHLVQKNWMPILGSNNDPLRIIYSAQHATILDVDPARGVVSSPSALGHGRLRGGSQAVSLGSAEMIYLVHDVAFPGSGRMYLHRFVKADRDGKILAMTDPFYFEKLGIEFCAGLAIADGEIIASYSIHDASSRLATFNLSRMIDQLKTDYVV